MKRNYFRQLRTVSLWEYKRFYKLKNEIIGIVVLLGLFTMGYFGGTYAVRGLGEKQQLMVAESIDAQLLELLEQNYEVTSFREKDLEQHKEHIASEKEGMLLWKKEEGGYALFAYKKPGRMSRLQEQLNEKEKLEKLDEIGLTQQDLENINQPARLETEFIYQPQRSQQRIVALFFAGLMVMAVFMSFAYQFTAITGEKQLKITEQIVSAIKPQVWMDGKIVGITLTGLSSMVTYTILSIIGGMIFFLISGAPVASINNYLYPPALLIFFLFTLVGILMWNSLMAAIAAIITDPNNSGKSSLMMVPSLFALASLLVLNDPDNSVSVFLSWFPLTSASGMPMRWVSTEIEWWELTGSFALLVATFYLMRKLAAKIFRVSILISGKEPTWSEVWKMARQD
ncbi:MAG: ABC transporter permease [Bacteroidota bacterium]